MILLTKKSIFYNYIVFIVSAQPQGAPLAIFHNWGIMKAYYVSEETAMFSNAPRCRYHKNQLGEVICQLRFPEILTIETNLPGEFQEAIRASFPLYSSRKEAAAPKLTGTPGNMKLEPQRQITNHQFQSEGRLWRVTVASR